VLVWHGDLVHGGAPTSSPRTRKSLVTRARSRRCISRTASRC
jgi:hypothetical protein